VKLPQSMLDKIEHLGDERTAGNGWLVTLHYGWAIDPIAGCHTFGEDTLSDVRRTMARVQSCRCAECRGHGAA
jgi:hypothetical protein